MKYIILLLLVITFSCKKENKNSAIRKSENSSIDHLQNKIVLDTIRSIVKEDTLIFQLKNASIFFTNRKESCWKNIQIRSLKDKVLTQIKTSNDICFEKNHIADFSPNQKYLLLHAIEKGILSDGNYSEEVEKYNCMFLDIDNKIISDKYSDLFCSGEWKNQDQWIVDEEENYKGKELFED